MKREEGEMKFPLPAVIIALAVFGILDSFYLLGVNLQILGESSERVASMCIIGSDACNAAARSDYAELFGIPNDILGVGYFGIVLAISGYRCHRGRWPAPWAFGAVLLAGAAYSAYLTHALTVILDTPCPFCLAAHAANLAIIIFFAVSAAGDARAARSLPDIDPAVS